MAQLGYELRNAKSAFALLRRDSSESFRSWRRGELNPCLVKTPKETDSLPRKRTTENNLWTSVNVVSMVVRYGKHSTTRRFQVLVRLRQSPEWSPRSAEHKRDRSKESAATRGEVGIGDSRASHCTANAEGHCRALSRHHWATYRFPNGPRVFQFMGRAQKTGNRAEHLRFLSGESAAIRRLARQPR